MHCFVYKSGQKGDHYLYLAEPFEKDTEEKLPSALIELLGELQLVVEFDLHSERKLPQADAGQVLESLRSQGFYLQMPRKDMLAEEDQWFN